MVRKWHWQIPSSWMKREDEDVEANLVTTRKGNLEEVLDGFQRGTVKAVRHP
jgi:hypothetical protein